MFKKLIYSGRIPSPSELKIMQREETAREADETAEEAARAEEEAEEAAFDADTEFGENNPLENDDFFDADGSAPGMAPTSPFNGMAQPQHNPSVGIQSPGQFTGQGNGAQIPSTSNIFTAPNGSSPISDAFPSVENGLTDETDAPSGTVPPQVPPASLQQISDAPDETINAPYAGSLKISVVSALGQFPIEGATVTIAYTGDPDSIIDTLTTNSSGQTDTVELPAPPLSWSMDSTPEGQPYSEYNITVTAPGYEPVLVTGSEILAGQLSLQPIRMNPLEATEDEEKIVVIPAHTLFGDFPPKIPEEEIKPMPETGEIVLSRVVIPEYVIVHDGVPSDSTAANYWVRYKDYIKNVASCEIYSTWPESAIYANILVIMSFTLNRVYTEWYRNQGYDFTITSSTAYDQKWVYGRNIYENIDYLVDTVFANYLSRPGVRQPIFTSYCDGKRVTCDGLSQWGSMYLGDEGYSAIEIIRYYFGNDMYINTADVISGVPSSWPGYSLTIGSSGEKVRQLQTQLNRIARNYPAIPTIVADGIYGSATAEAVQTFQGIFNLPKTGVTDYATWYEISDIYVGVTRIAEPD